MSSTVCRGSQTCLDPALLHERRVLGLKSPLPKSNSHPSALVHLNNGGSSCKSQENTDVGWSFFKPLGNLSCGENAESDVVYVHPRLARCRFMNEKSLAMCTESLGSESGSESISDCISLFSAEGNSVGSREMESERISCERKKKMSRLTSFPPPLSSISGSAGGVKVMRSHRESGRLVLEAVTLPFNHIYKFHAERSEGRLRLSLVKHRAPESDKEEAKEEDDQFHVEEEEEENEAYVRDKKRGSGRKGASGQEEEEEEDEDEEEEEE